MLYPHHGGAESCNGTRLQSGGAKRIVGDDTELEGTVAVEELLVGVPREQGRACRSSVQVEFNHHHPIFAHHEVAHAVIHRKQISNGRLQRITKQEEEKESKINEMDAMVR